MGFTAEFARAQRRNRNWCFESLLSLRSRRFSGDGSVVSFAKPDVFRYSMGLPMRSFREELAERILLCDGAMGTMLYQKGIFINRCFDELNLSSPDMVKDIHKAYVQAGVDIIETNTFGANKFKLMFHGLTGRRRRSTSRRRGLRVRLPERKRLLPGRLVRWVFPLSPSQTGLRRGERGVSASGGRFAGRRSGPVCARDFFTA